MTKTQKIAIVAGMLLLLSACKSMKGFSNETTAFVSQSHVQYNVKKQYSATAPESVMILSNQPIETPYRIIGKVRVANYNLVGIKRQKAVINDLLQKNASVIGGNAVIDVHHSSKETIAEVIRFVS